ncbi:hypothetical protein, partial [Tetragenococcus halophilus]|uniref:hypothetical protein n=1 Tax=Tetragenococcus halophilus TaxID=51669 RepID=UPI001C56E634
STTTLDRYATQLYQGLSTEFDVRNLSSLVNFYRFLYQRYPQKLKKASYFLLEHSDPKKRQHREKQLAKLIALKSVW